MRFYLTVLLAVLLSIGCFAQRKSQKTVQPSLRKVEVRLIDTKELTSFLASTSDTIYVVNFWATWCKPCVAELPSFVSAANQYKGQPVKIQLISLDFKSDTQKVKQLLGRAKYAPLNSWLMTNIDYDSWINLVSPEWGGAIPATLIFNNAKGKRKFIGNELTAEELVAEIEAMR
jgi:thiol-disulfide isomerase/thioredoxin